MFQHSLTYTMVVVESISPNLMFEKTTEEEPPSTGRVIGLPLVEGHDPRATPGFVASAVGG